MDVVILPGHAGNISLAITAYGTANFESSLLHMEIGGFHLEAWGPGVRLSRRQSLRITGRNRDQSPSHGACCLLR
jgi:hypothetical protein